MRAITCERVDWTLSRHQIPTSYKINDDEKMNNESMSVQGASCAETI